MKNLLEIDALSIQIGDTSLVDSVCFSLNANKTLALVGESGSGKSLTALSLVGLLPKQASVSAKKLRFEAQSLLEIKEAHWRTIRGRQIGMVFQEPQSSLNPSMRCGKQLLEVLQLHAPKNKNPKSTVLEVFDQVQLPDPNRIFQAYPHELSGGQKQRVMIAMALICEPKLLICDEPTTALDATVQKEILILLKQLQQQNKMGILFISHDLGMVKNTADDVVVMQHGKIVEQGPTYRVFTNPKHPYTKGLLSARPPIDRRPLQLITLNDFQNNTIITAEETKAARLSRHELLYSRTPLLRVEKISKAYPQKGYFWQKKEAIQILDPINFNIYPGETLGLVGESGSGKSTLARSLSQLIPPSTGTAYFEEKAVQRKTATERKILAQNIQYIFQDPYAALHPKKKLGHMLTEVLEMYAEPKPEKRVDELLTQVGLDPNMRDRYPHQLSGGQRQRAVIARALAPNPKLIICDEAVAALDISVQAQVLNLLNQLKKDLQLSYLFISHDLAVVRYMADRILVLNQGKMESLQEADDLYKNPKTPYIAKLIDAAL